MRSLAVHLALVCNAFVLGSALAADTPSNGKRLGEVVAGRILITGSSTMAPLVSAIARRFHARYPRVQINVESGGSGRGLADTRAGKSNIGMVSRAMSEADKDLYGLPIARDGVALVIHRDNPISALTSKQLIDIYTGRATNWKQVGGRNTPILVIKSEEKRSSSELFTHFLQVRYDELKSSRTAGDNPERIRLICDNANAIIYTSLGEAERNALQGLPLKLLPVDGIAATIRTVRSGDYPISRPLTLVTKGNPTGLIKLFIDFAASSQVSDLVIAHDFVPYLD